MLIALSLMHPGLSRAREVGLTAQQHEHLGVAKDQAKRYPGCLATVSLDRNSAAQWTTGFGVHGVVNALRTGNDLVWRVQYGGSSDRFALSRCLHPMERCALQGFRPEQFVGMSKSGFFCAQQGMPCPPQWWPQPSSVAWRSCCPLGHGCPARHTAARRREGAAPNCHKVVEGVHRLVGGPGGRVDEDGQAERLCEQATVQTRRIRKNQALAAQK